MWNWEQANETSATVPKHSFCSLAYIVLCKTALWIYVQAFRLLPSVSTLSRFFFLLLNDIIEEELGFIFFFIFDHFLELYSRIEQWHFISLKLNKNYSNKFSFCFALSHFPYRWGQARGGGGFRALLKAPQTYDYSTKARARTWDLLITDTGA